jgi:hypothetical protein
LVLYLPYVRDEEHEQNIAQLKARIRSEHESRKGDRGFACQNESDPVNFAWFEVIIELVVPPSNVVRLGIRRNVVARPQGPQYLVELNFPLVFPDKTENGEGVAKGE